VLGVYPSALHVRWTPPAWAEHIEGVAPIGALAVDDEPTVFWDGRSPSEAELVERWMRHVGFRPGDAPGDWGHVRPAGNGTSGRPVAERVLRPLGITPDQATFSDCVNTYFVKGGRGSQGASWRERFEPFAAEAGLAAPTIPARPAVDDLVRLAVDEHRDRLRAELLESGAPIVLTLGEEARRVLAGIADEVEGPPTETLSTKGGISSARYGEEGRATIGERTIRWMALVHPGQRSKAWGTIHDGWVARRR
jgi:hypothetical protein